jgi:hypothetical protein
MTGLFTWLGGVLRGFWEALKGFLTSFWGILIGLVASLTAFLHWLGDKIGQLANFFVHIADGSWHAAVGSPCGSEFGNILALANTFYPLDETLRLFFAMVVSVWLPLGIYRMVKSMIPEFEGGS